jgi:hypothetical protein
MKPENEGARTMVPLTASMYVPGQLTDVKAVLVESMSIIACLLLCIHTYIHTYIIHIVGIDGSSL